VTMPPGHIPFDDFNVACFVGSLALAVILFEGGLSTERAMVRKALWPAIAMSTLGVLVSAALVGALSRCRTRNAIGLCGT
jgi:cell volume regulation protein A